MSMQDVSIIGFNPDMLRTSIREVQSAYNNFMTQMSTNIQNNFVNELALYWGDNQAQMFFTKFKSSIDSIINESNNVFQSVFDSMNDAGKLWTSTKSPNSIWSEIPFERVNPTLDISLIKNNIDGLISMDTNTVINVTNSSLNSVMLEATRALEDAQRAVQECGFVGGNSATNLCISLGKIKTRVGELVQNILESSKRSIEASASDYINIEAQVSDAFTGNK